MLDVASIFSYRYSGYALNNVSTMPARTLALESRNDLHYRVTKLYEDAREDVYYYVMTLGLSAAQAQEVTQEVFLRLFTVLRDGEEIENPRAWVFRVAHNFGLNTRAKEREHGTLDNEVERTPAGQDTPEQQAMAAERRARIEAALADLSPQQRQCLHLRASGLRYREIAEAVGIGTSTANEFIRRAVSRLRKALHE